MASFQSLLQVFDVTLQKYNPINYAALKPPLPKKEVEVYMESWGVKDKNLKDLLCWKNGFDFRGRIQNCIFEWGALLSVEKMNHYIKDYDTEPEVTVDGKRIFICITENGSGDALLYSLQKEKYGKIHLFSVALLYIQEPISYYDSLSSMIATEIEAYEKGAYKWNSENGWLDIDTTKFFSIAKALNPQSDYWK